MQDRVSLGVLVGSKMLKRLSAGNGDIRLVHLIKANQTAGTDLFFFALKDVDIYTRKIRGSIQLDSGDWVKREFVYPQAFYRLCIPPHQEREHFSAFIKQLRVRGVVFLNYQSTLDKWDAFDCIGKTPELRQHLPFTQLVEKNSQILDLLEKSPVLYVKACKSGKGKKVMRVENLHNGEYVFSRYFRTLTRGVLDGEVLLQEIDSFLGSSDIIAQTAIDLVQVKGRNVDFRAEVQRNGSDSPHVVAIPVRIARKGSPITTHSSSMSLERFCAEHPSIIPDYEEFKNRATAFLLNIYQAIEGCFGPCGELGMDFGMDRKGKLWFIEGNTQSTKVSLLNSYPEPFVVQSFAGLLDYAKVEVGNRRKKLKT